MWQTIEQHVDKKKWIDKKAATARFACSIDNTNGIDGGKKACGGDEVEYDAKGKMKRQLPHKLQQL